MQKEQNVIKNSIFFQLLIISNYLFSQSEKINGRYSSIASLQEHYNYYVFDKNGEFRYHVGACLGDDYFGFGDYQFINNYLILNYNKTEPIKTGYHVSEIWTNNKDTIYLKINILDFDGFPLHGVSVIYKDSLSKYGYSGVASNKEGVALVNLKKDKTDLDFEISHLGFNIYKFSLDKNYNHNISVFLQKQGDGLPILNQIDTLEIVKIRPKYFTVKRKDGNIATWRKVED